MEVEQGGGPGGRPPRPGSAPGPAQWGQAETGTAVIKVTALGRELLLDEEEAVVEEAAEGEAAPFVPFIVQPNFDVLVPLETYDAIAWELEEVADLVRVDTMRIHRLTKASVLRAFDLGWTAETVQDFLREGTGGIVPGNVERMIQQWESEFSRVQLYRAVVVACKDESIARDLKGLPEVAAHVRLDVTPTHFLIAEAGLPALQDTLRKMGYPADLLH